MRYLEKERMEFVYYFSYVLEKYDYTNKIT